MNRAFIEAANGSIIGVDLADRPTLATRIFDLAERVDRNVQRNDEAFHIERDEIVRELKELAMEARG